MYSTNSTARMKCPQNLKYLSDNIITKKEFEHMLHIGHGKSHKLLHESGFTCFKIGRQYFIYADKAIDWLLIHHKI